MILLCFSVEMARELTEKVEERMMRRTFALDAEARWYTLVFKSTAVEYVVTRKSQRTSYSLACMWH
jgi:hypothetical protein